MRAKSLDERELVRNCLSALCSEAGFADTGNLVQRDLLFLCDRIESKTGVVISLSTIKRLLNGQFSRMPQVATLDAMAMTLGYPNWQAYRSAGNPGVRRRPVRARWWLLGAVMCLLALGSLAVMRMGRHRIGNAGAAKFSATKVTGNDLPNTVVFTYDIDAVTADSFFIQQSWDKNRRVRIYKNAHTLTDIYLEPGYHVAKLIANDQIIKTADVSIPTDRWVYYAQKSLGGAPKYIVPAKSLQLTPQDLVSSNIDPRGEHLYLMVNFPSTRTINSDSFTLRFRIRVGEVMDGLCPFFMGEVFCQRYFMYFKSTPPGCSSESVAQFGENFLSGKTHDFSVLGTDVRAWQRVELTVRHRSVGIALNGKPVFSTVYREPCGMITGLGFISNGLCQVDSIDVR